jgi:hypothetical protein
MLSDGPLVCRHRNEGGTLSQNGVTLEVPPGALSSSTVIAIAAADNPPADSRLVAGTAFDFMPNGTSFATPATVSIPYSSSNFPAGTELSQLRLGHFTENTWTVIEGAVVDTQAAKVRGPVVGFSGYGILVVPSSLPPGSPPPGQTSYTLVFQRCSAP